MADGLTQRLQRFVGHAVPVLLAANAVALVGLLVTEATADDPASPAGVETPPPAAGGGPASRPAASPVGQTGAGGGTGRPAATTTATTQVAASKGTITTGPLGLHLPVDVPDPGRIIDEATKTITSTVTTIQSTVSSLVQEGQTAVTGITGTAGQAGTGADAGTGASPSTGSGSGSTTGTITSVVGDVTSKLPGVPK